MPSPGSAQPAAMMASPALLEFLAQAVRAHSARGTAAWTRVVRVVLADPELDAEETEALAALVAGVAVYSGRARGVHADSAETEFAAGSTEPELRGALRIIDDSLSKRPGPPLDVEIDDRGVRITDKDADVLSKGERELVGLLGALVDPGWEGSALGVVTYSEESMDPFVKRAAWDAVTAGLDEKRVAGLETLLVIARTGRIDTGRHCADRFGAEWVVDADRLVRRGSLESARQHASDLARTSSGPTVLYLGAGFSFSSGLPSGNDLRDHALRSYFETDPEAAVEPLARKLFQSALEAGKLAGDQLEGGEDGFVGRYTLEDVIALVTELTNQPAPTLEFFAEQHEQAHAGAAIDSLAALVGRVRGLVIVTVNFDELIERACPDGSVHRVVTEQEFVGFPDYLQRYLEGEERAVPIVKLHGTISVVETCVVSARETRSLLPAPKADALRALTKAVDGPRENWVYIGTSMRDRDIVPVLKEPEFPKTFEEAWVMPLRAVGIDVLGDHRAGQWEHGQPTLDARTYSVSADAFMRFMAAAVP